MSTIQTPNTNPDPKKDRGTMARLPDVNMQDHYEKSSLETDSPTGSSPSLSPINTQSKTQDNDTVLSPPIVNHPNLIRERKDLENFRNERPSQLKNSGRINTSIRFENTEDESRPSIFLFIFVNPLSGDCKGQDLITLPFQHFRLRRFPQVQVEIHNILDEKDRALGIESIQLVDTMSKLGKLPSLEDMEEKDYKNEDHHISKTARTRHIHVWSAGGDGTVMSVFEMLVHHQIDLDNLFFSCIPFGTGNDFSQVLGWGRTIPHPNILGKKLYYLEELITERLEKSEAARLDIWQVEMTAHTSGYVRLAGPDRDDGHDAVEINAHEPNNTVPPSMVRKMCNYMSIGVQGYVGSGFEKHRTGNRWLNMMVYASESAKWLFWRHFPSVTSFIEKIVCGDQTMLVCSDPDDKHAENPSDLPYMTRTPIDFVIQNIPHIWGREVDLWGDAKSGLEVVENRSGFTDPENWTPQLANDGKMEIMSIENTFSYLKKLANIRQHVSRIGQFATPFEIVFRDPKKTKKKSLWPFSGDNKFKRNNVICIMCDGEFYVLKDPKSLKFKRFAQIWTLGKHAEDSKGRLVVDEKVAEQQKHKHKHKHHQSNDS
ncbi:ATP-NAD kinase-like domain-containing protein [Choanephora cucurbitarum]|nr:ATP-NAD kinase-like domain-containing protein [Choanephora cucurbitarum]